jgi:O-antigen/teichoic acid export membrane protein
VNTATATRSPGRRSGVRRLGWGISDQALSSVTNFALAVLVARTVSTADLGAFGLAFTTYTFVLGATRAICSEPMSVRYSDRTEEAWERGARRATGAAAVIGVLSGMICAGASMAFTGTLQTSLLVLGLCMPGLIVQDTWRTAFFSHLRGRSAFVNDLIWAMTQLVFVTALLSGGHRSAPAYLLAWGLAANVAAVAGSLQSSIVPRPSSTKRWFRRQRDIAPRYVLEFLARNVANAGSMYLAAAFGGLSAAGALRGAQVVLGPLNILNQGLTAPSITEAVRISRRSPRRMLRMVTLLAVTIAGVSVVWGLLMYLLPEHVGRELLRRSWAPAHGVILPYAAVMAAAGSLTGATVGLRALVATRRSLQARFITGALSLACTATGAYLDGAPGAAIGLAVGLWAGSFLWWKGLRHEVAAAERVRLSDALLAESPAGASSVPTAR